MDNNSLFIMGLPSAGKTSFLAALAYSLQQRKEETKLQWRNYTGNHRYLAKLAERWLTAESVERTSSSEQQINLDVELYDEKDNRISLRFPDLSGEIFQNMYEHREIDIEIADIISNCDGVILFINPLELKEPTLISNLPLSVRNTDGEDGTYSERNPVADDSSAVLLVELLQFSKTIAQQKEQKLMVIVSAWDVVLLNMGHRNYM